MFLYADSDVDNEGTNVFFSNDVLCCFPVCGPHQVLQQIQNPVSVQCGGM